MLDDLIPFLKNMNIKLLSKHFLRKFLKNVNFSSIVLISNIYLIIERNTKKIYCKSSNFLQYVLSQGNILFHNR